MDVTKETIWQKTILKKIRHSELENYDSLVQIGNGSCGIVYESKWNLKRVAIKSFGSSTPSFILNEISIHEKLKHENVVELLGLYSEPGRKNIMLVMELSTIGCLYDLFGKKQFEISTTDRIWILIHAARGMEYISSKNILHNDLAARNILVFLQDNSDCDESKYISKISDFGFSCILKEDCYRMKAIDGPIKWYGPEVFEMEGYFTYYKSSDVWSFGILIGEIFSEGNLNLYSHIGGYAQVRDAISKKSIKLEMPKDCRKDICSIADQCLNYNHLERPSFTELIRLLEKSLVKEIEDVSLNEDFDIIYSDDNDNLIILQTIVDDNVDIT